MTDSMIWGMLESTVPSMSNKTTCQAARGNSRGSVVKLSWHHDDKCMCVRGQHIRQPARQQDARGDRMGSVLEHALQ